MAGASMRAADSKSNPETASPSGPAASSIPASTGIVGLAGTARMAQPTASLSADRSTWIFTLGVPPHRLLFWGCSW